MSLPNIQELIDRKALFVVNHSGGKDSQAMYIKLFEMVPADQIVVVHAHLPEVEWDGVIEHIETTVAHDVHVVQAGKTFFEMVERRGMWPSASTRQCTSDLKRGPIEKFIRHYLLEHPEHNGLVVNCMGLRAEESSSRAKKPVLKLNARNSKAGREWYDWLPIHDMLVREVFDTIRSVRQEPHWAYGAGMTRLSCVFCIMSSEQDICTAARLNPELAKRYMETERRLDHSMSMQRKFLDEIVRG